MSQMSTDGRDGQTYAIIGAAMEVHATLGSGFLEVAYQESLAIECKNRAISFRRESLININYKNHLLPINCHADFVCFDRIEGDFALIVGEYAARPHKSSVLIGVICG